MTDIIRDWMQQGCKYNDGVKIYEQIGSNEAVKKVLKLGSTDYFKKKLMAAMNELLAGGHQEVNNRVESQLLTKTNNPPSDDSTARIEIKSYRNGDIYLLPDDVGMLIKLKGQTYNDAATLHATLLKDNDGEKRKKAAYEILRLMAINQNCWAKLNYYDKYGALPMTDVPTDYTYLNSGERDLMIQKHRVYLSRHRWLHEPDAIEHPKYLYYSKEYARRKKELEELEKGI